MSNAYMGQIIISSFGFARKYSAFCNGGLMPIAQNAALFSLLGNTYGGDGRTTFGLPDMRGRTPVGQSPNQQTGETGGAEQVTLNSTQIPPHTHIAIATSDAGTARTPVNNLYAKASAKLYGPATGQTVTLHPSTLSSSGQNQPHDNMQPYSVLNFCILLQGVYPSRG
ncbi:tail fiber protein [Bacillus subtilis subsp. subtilis]|nr:tail fiber protein [Bacillus subtilis subsp. subtilis]